MTYMKLGNVLPFPGVKPTKQQTLKVLEEAAEVFGAWQEAEISKTAYADPEEREVSGYAFGCGEVLLNEIADTIQASCNLAAALGVTDLTPYLARCEERNRKRGRYEQE